MKIDVETSDGKRTSMLPALEQQLARRITRAREEGHKLLADYGDRKLSEVTVKQAYGGMRGVKCMVTETSSVDPYEGIRFRGYTIPELREQLPKTAGGHEPLPEGVFHLLLTGEIPGAEDVARITETWRENETLPGYVMETLDRLPVDTHPMT